MLSFNIGLSGIRASQVGIDATANNIANADRPDYHRQSVVMSAAETTLAGNHFLGNGVKIEEIRRVFAFLIEDSLSQNISQQSSASQQLGAFQQIETMLTAGDGSLQNQLQSLFDRLTALTANPGDAITRATVLQQANSLAEELHDLSANLNRLRNAAANQLSGELPAVNGQLAELASVNKQLSFADSQNKSPNHLLDRRSQLINELSASIDLTAHQQGGSDLSVLIANKHVYMDDRAVVLRSQIDNSGRMQIFAKGMEGPLTFGGGTIEALQQVANEIVPGIQQQIDSLASGLAFTFDKIHSTGLPIDGPQQILRGTRKLANANVPIAEAKPAFAVSGGKLYVSITDQASGNRRLHAIAFDPEFMSLNDLAAAISGIDHLQATVDKNAFLTIKSEDGFSFDFAGRVETTTDLSAVSGTSVPRLSGNYSGEQNDQFTYRIIGSGTVGATDGLRAEVKNAAGDIVADLDLGSDYQPGSALPVSQGVEISFASGTLNDGDTFSSFVVAQPDASGILATLGLNTFFTGRSAADLQVNPDLLKNPDRFATSKSGDPADSRNILELLKQRDVELASLGGGTFEEFVARIVNDVAASGSELNTEVSDLEVLGNRLETERASAIGVDPNEEFVKLMQFQRSFEMAAQIITVSDQNLQTLLAIFG